MPVLKDVLRDVPHIEFDKCLSWEEWALPDQLVYSSITAPLRIARSHSSYAAAATETIYGLERIDLGGCLGSRLGSGTLSRPTGGTSKDAWRKVGKKGSKSTEGKARAEAQTTTQDAVTLILSSPIRLQMSRTPHRRYRILIIQETRMEPNLALTHLSSAIDDLFVRRSQVIDDSDASGMLRTSPSKRDKALRSFRSSGSASGFVGFE
ncbi:hypothetical protein F5878DRAFT_663685 [Lentinula raphanica]|uniref:Uncharacterized protein n=1 Tax=Lentinula raphanica TaxID=153919 RepID=A0AA38P3R7_9AGAR|nr:hypothetical protein F5878DRAFT_663685 [Lentinula raphanica]